MGRPEVRQWPVEPPEQEAVPWKERRERMVLVVMVAVRDWEDSGGRRQGLRDRAVQVQVQVRELSPRPLARICRFVCEV